MKTIAIFCFTIIATTIAASNLPSNFKVCKRSDPNVSKCLTNAVKEAIIFLSEGLESFKIMPLEPLKLMLNFSETQNTSVTLKQEYKNGELYGLTKRFELHDFQIDWNNSVMKFYISHEHIDFISDYKIEGKILLVPIYGEGNCKISVDDLTMHHEVDFEMFEKNGESYIRVKKYFIKTSYKRVAMHYDNLFNGNKVLGEEVNKFLNENSMILYQEFKQLLEESFARKFFKISNKIFTRVPMNKIFPLA